ncbi:MAG: bacillithiol biosynthesis deacetylase BshB1 [Candidatus Accumulibacter phosphatis]|uniref:Bacillithiol biosynthesis deacetylase BshB1 n=1 Tax=Candidatus Accumulibacter phosphatis TaxID=327160 RepID=A0A080LWG4_9PROT|nr:MAG: bacillithiol biosynthesis deacetylase BshB1 [Candidatus Accumulibacter phosphatis]
MLPYRAQQWIPATGVLVLAPHPDDEVFGCGGALAAHVAAGVPVRVVILTNGALFGDPHTRLNESCSAGRLLGYGKPESWNFPDRGLEYGEPLVARLLAAITASAADLVYAPSLREIHPDHRQLAMAAAEAVRRVGGALRLAQYEVGVPLRPNLLLDITPFADLKQQAMACFVSQLRHQRYDEHILALNRYRTYTLTAEVRLAEAYALVSAQALRENALLDLVEPEYVFQARLGFPCSSQDVPLVSVVVRRPAGSDLRLRLSLDSLALQTYPNIEVLLVDGDPGLPALPGNCGRHLLRQIRTNRCLSAAAASNAGFDEASGTYCLVLDAGKSIPPEHASSLVFALRKQSSCHAAYASAPQREGNACQASGEGIDCDAVRLLCRPDIPLRAVLFDLCLVNKGCRFDESLEGEQDWDFLLQLSLASAFLPVACAAPFPEEPANARETPAPTSLLAMCERWRTRCSSAQLASLMRRACDPPQLAVLRRQMAELQLTMEEKSRFLAARDRELLACRSTVESLRIELDERELRIAELRLQVQEHERQRAEMLASHSWRITRPLRCLSAAWREWCRK